MVSFSLRQRISLPPLTGPRSGVLSFESIRAILDLLTNRDKAQKMAENGKRVALRDFDERRVFKIVETEYARLIKAKDTSKPVGKRFNNGAKLVS